MSFRVHRRPVNALKPTLEAFGGDDDDISGVDAGAAADLGYGVAPHTNGAGPRNTADGDVDDEDADASASGAGAPPPCARGSAGELQRLGAAAAAAGDYATALHAFAQVPLCTTDRPKICIGSLTAELLA